MHQSPFNHSALMDFDDLVVHVPFDLAPSLEFERFGGVHGPVDRAADHDVGGLHFAVDARILRNTGLVNFLDGCAATLPCQAPGAGPVGMMVCGPAMSDAHVLAVAQAIERVLAA